MVDWVLENYRDGQKLTRVGQERYAEAHGLEMRSCSHCYHVEDGEECCHCQSTGLTDEPGNWVGSREDCIPMPRAEKEI